MGTQLPPKGHSPLFSAHVYCGKTVAHLSYTAENLCIYCAVIVKLFNNTSMSWYDFAPHRFTVNILKYFLIATITVC